MSALDRSKGADLPKDPDAQGVQKKPSDKGSESQMPHTMQTDDDANGGAMTAPIDKHNAVMEKLREEHRRLTMQDANMVQLREQLRRIQRLVEAWNDRDEWDSIMQEIIDREYL